MCDNTTAIFYVNHMIGQKSEDSSSLAIWRIERNLWITASHIPDCNTVMM